MCSDGRRASTATAARSDREWGGKKKKRNKTAHTYWLSAVSNGALACRGGPGGPVTTVWHNTKRTVSNRGQHQHAAVQRGTARYSAVQRGTARYSPVQRGIARYSAVQSGTVRYIQVQPGTTQYSPVQPCLTDDSQFNLYELPYLTALSPTAALPPTPYFSESSVNRPPARVNAHPINRPHLTLIWKHNMVKRVALLGHKLVNHSVSWGRSLPETVMWS